jgi:hypothetical protein
MGYACPVCTTPQADDVHLANHLAFTALTGDSDHEAWLDDHVDVWDQLGPSELAVEVTDHAEKTEFPQMFEASGHEKHTHNTQDIPNTAHTDRSLSDADEAVLSEARELTEQMRESSSREDETE